ncbi:MAG: hypothetical protein HHAS10_00200 [Candidatus Altimarinota bacterium]
MEALFTEEARKNFIIGITEIILQIFDISSEERRNIIINELSALDDATLLEKKDSIDDYFLKANEINKSYFYQLLRMEHLYLEKEEQKDLDKSLEGIILA